MIETIKCDVFSINDQKYMCAYEGIKTVFDSYVAYFLVNGESKSIMLSEDDVRDLSGENDDESLTTDRALDSLKYQFEVDPSEYVICWKLYEEVC